MATWGFYGREEALEELGRIVNGGRWFFCRIEGRRRIGKTSLLSQLAKQAPRLSDQLVYMQVPDSDERDVATAFQRSLLDCDDELTKRLGPTVINFPTMARAIGELCRAGPPSKTFRLAFSPLNIPVQLPSILGVERTS